jgi:hypothetical protein
MLNYVSTEPYVQVAFLALIGLIVVVGFINRKWSQSEKNDFKREQARREWAREDAESRSLVKRDDIEGM